ncbi:DNA-directed RNA polymerase sigma-70 factor [Bacteroidota bacterium]|nr:DNA-directed RNA polymerase sigma-70 factor [Bacteroidota bacterium]
MKFRIKQHFSDEELITGCLRGERRFQEGLYNQHGSTMFSICLRYASDYYQAEDMLQEGFIKVFNHLKNFRNEGSFEGWMKRIFVNTAIEWLRKNKVMNEMQEIENVPLHIVQEDCFSQLAADDLMKLIQSLSPGYRTVFNLYSIEGYSHKEIGEMMNINEGTSKSQLARARYILQKMVVQSNKVQYAAAVL